MLLVNPHTKLTSAFLRFTLLQDLSAQELEAEQRTQALLVNELTELTSMLKESTLDINKAVNLQNIVSTSCVLAVLSISPFSCLMWWFRDGD
jgi:hypothetical protein